MGENNDYMLWVFLRLEKFYKNKKVNIKIKYKHISYVNVAYIIDYLVTHKLISNLFALYISSFY